MNAVTGPRGNFRYLGKNPHTPKTSDLKLAKYLDRATLIDVAMAPLDLDWSAFPTPSGALPTPDTDPLGNNVAGDCVWTSPGHMVNLIGKQVGRSDLIVTKEMAIAAYSKYTGYDPTTGEGDNGSQVRDMLAAWQKDGLYGTKCLAYALVDWTNSEEVDLASWLGMGLIGGYSLPLASQTQNDADGRPQWIVPVGGFPAGQGPGTWGGHCIYSHGASANTWGESLLMTQDWINACCDELWLAVIDASQLATGRVPAGFAWQDFLNDVAARQTA
jgi:hypothetical protein